MITRSHAIAVAAIGFACSSAHQIGEDGNPFAGTGTTVTTGSGDSLSGGYSVTSTIGAGGSVTTSGGGGDFSVGAGSVTTGAGGADFSVGTVSATVGTGGSAGAGGAGGSGFDAGAGFDGGDASKIIPPEDSSSASSPVRIVFFYTPLGTVLDSWRPLVGTNGAFSLPSILKPLEPYKDRLLIVDGIDNLVHPGVMTDDLTGPALLLTGQASSDSRSAGGPSLGPLLAAKWSTVAFAGLQLGVQSAATIEFGGPSMPFPPNNNPAQAAQLILNGAPPTGIQFSNTTDFASAGHQMMDLVRLAIQYDRTRVMSLAWGDVNGATTFSWIAGVDKSYRELATNSGVTGPDREHFIAVQTWYAQQFAYLVNALAIVPEGNGSLLDHTLLLWVSETGEASARTGKSIPVVMAGNMLGRFRNGTYLQTSGSQLNLLSTIAELAGIAPFGDATLGRAPIGALLKP